MKVEVGQRKMTGAFEAELITPSVDLEKCTIVRGDQYTTIIAVRQASDEGPLKGFSVYRNMLSAAEFIGLPGVARILKPKGYDFTLIEKPHADKLHPEVTITGRYPRLPDEPEESTAWGFKSDHRDEFKFKDQIRELSHRRVLISNAGDDTYEPHDNLIHRLFLEVVLSTPELVPLMEALQAKAEDIENYFNSPDRDKTLGFSKVKSLRYLGHMLDTNIAIDGAITKEMKKVFYEGGDREDSTRIIAQNIRSIFTHNTGGAVGSEFSDLELDPEVTDATILEWADHFIQIAEERVAA